MQFIRFRYIFFSVLTHLLIVGLVLFSLSHYNPKKTVNTKASKFQVEINSLEKVSVQPTKQKKIVRKKILNPAEPQRALKESSQEKVVKKSQEKSYHADLTEHIPDNTPEHIKALLKNLSERLQENQSYPYIAKRLRQSGTVFVNAEILPNGNVTNVKLNKSSNFKSLDESALEQVKNVGRLLPEPGSKISVLVPIGFKLN